MRIAPICSVPRDYQAIIKAFEDPRRFVVMAVAQDRPDLLLVNSEWVRVDTYFDLSDNSRSLHRGPDK